MKNKLTFLLALFSAFLFIVPVSAFGISPVKMLLTAEPGANQTVVLKINNTASASQIFKLHVLGVTQDDAGLPIFGRNTDEAENWVYPEDNTVQVKAGETKSVNFIIKIPSGVEAGSHYVGLAAEPVSAIDSQNSLSSRLISLLTLQIKGLVQEELFVEKWEPDARISGNKNHKFDLKLRNSGVVEVPMRGVIAIRDWRGDEIVSAPVVSGNKLLAGSRRALSPAVTLGDNVNLPGLYQVQLKINYGLTNQTATAVAYLWYFPRWSQITAAIFGLLVIFFFVALIKRKK